MRLQLLSLLLACAPLCASLACVPASPPTGAEGADGAEHVQPSAGLTLTVSFEAQPDDEQLARWRELVAEASAILWRATEGHFYVARCRMLGRASSGEVWVRAPEAGASEARARFELTDAGHDSWQLEVRDAARDPQAARELARALAQGALGLEEHAECEGGCLLSPRGERLCRDPLAHQPGRLPCAELLSQRHHGLVELDGRPASASLPSTRFDGTPSSS